MSKVRLFFTAQGFPISFFLADGTALYQAGYNVSENAGSW
jgi:hypothetical protein